MTDRDTTARAVLVAVLAAVVLGAVFWVIFWQQTAASALTRAPLLDEAWYLQAADRLRQDGIDPHVPFVMSPGYPLLVAAGGGSLPDDGVLARHPRGLLVVQALAWLACGLVAGGVVLGAGRRAGLGARAALAAAVATGLLCLLYRPAAVYARTILLEVPLAALVAGALAAGLTARPGGMGRAVLAGICLGLAAGLRAHVLVLLPLLVPWTWLAVTGLRRRAAAVGLLLVAALLPVALAAAHNTRAGGRPAGPSLNAGVNLYLGQLPHTGGLFTTVAGFDLERDPAGVTYLASRLGRPVDGPAEADRIWLAEARDRVLDAPGEAVRAWLRKAWLHLQGWEVAQVTPLGAWVGEAPVLRVLPVPWGLVVVLAVVGAAMALAARSRQRADGCRLPRPVWGWLLAVVLLIAAQSVFFVVTRYRLVLLPPLAVLAGLGMVSALGPGRRWLSLAVLPVAVLVVIPWGLEDARRTWSGLEAFNHAQRLLTLAGDRPAPDLRRQADALLARTCAVAGDRDEPWRLRAANQVRAGQPAAALTTLSEGAMQAADPAPLERARIALLRDAGRLDQAEALALAHLRDRPDDRDMLHDLAVLQGRRGRWQDAAATARRLQTVAPQDHRGWLDLGVALARLGQADAALAVFDEGLRRVPDGPGRALLAENRRRLAGVPDGP